MKVIFLTATFLISFIFLVTGNAKEIKICSFEWPPHHGVSLKNGGYTAEILKEIFEPQGYKIIKKFYPWARAQVYAKKGEVCDAITELYFNEERLQYYWFGMPYSVHEVYVMALKTHPVKNYNLHNIHVLRTWLGS